MSIRHKKSRDELDEKVCPWVKRYSEWGFARCVVKSTSVVHTYKWSWIVIKLQMCHQWCTPVLQVWCEAVKQALRISQFSPGLRVVDSIECQLQLYWWNKLTVLYSYDNKSCVHAKHIVIMNMFCVVKGRRYPRSSRKSWARKYMQIR
jgi:hypothetical protein